MPRIVIIARQDSAVVDEVVARVGEHFGADAVTRFAADSPPPWGRDDVAVLVLERPAPGAAAATPWPADAEPFIRQRIAAADAVIPVLVGGFVMPSARDAPAELRELCYMHALPLRQGPTLPRDVGRLIESLEVKLRWIVGDPYPHDGWLLTLGVAAVLVGLVYSVVLCFEVTDWSFAHEDVFEYRRAMRCLFATGPFALGAGLLLIGLGWWWRSVRNYSQLQAARLRQGTGAVPEKPSPWFAAMVCSGLAAGGWGLPAATAFVATAAIAFWKSGFARPTPRSLRIFAMVLLAAIVGTLWTTRTWKAERGLRQAIRRVEVARQEQTPEGMLVQLAKASDFAPWYAVPHLERALAYQDQNDDENALHAVDRAIELLPRDSQGVFEPTHRRIGEAYLLRADLYDRQGKQELAESDRESAKKADPWLVIFGGMFRFWEWRASTL